MHGHLLPITKTILVRRTKHAGHCWRSKTELIKRYTLWTHSHERAKAGGPARNYILQLCDDTGYRFEYLPGTMDDREGGERGSGRSVLAVWYDDDYQECYIISVFLFLISGFAQKCSSRNSEQYSATATLTCHFWPPSFSPCFSLFFSNFFVISSSKKYAKVEFYIPTKREKNIQNNSMI